MDRTFSVLLLVIAFGASVPSRADETTTAKDLAEVQGKWVRNMTTPSGVFKVVKEHKGNKTTVTFMDSAGRIVEAKESEFRLENTGKVRIFTFFNNVITAGPQKGRTDNEPHSYVYRITGDTFVEVKPSVSGSFTLPLHLRAP